MHAAYAAAAAWAPLALPFRWNVAMRLPTLGRWLTRKPLRWPVLGPEVVSASMRPFVEPSELPAIAPELVIAEASTPEELSTLVAGSHKHGWDLLVVAACGQAELGAWMGQLVLSPGELVLPRSDDVSAVRELGRYTESLVRERATLALVRYWRSAQEAWWRAGEAALPGSMPSGTLPSRPVFAPLATIEHVHVAAGLGLWFEAELKQVEFGVSPGRRHRVLEAGPVGLAAGLAPIGEAEPAKLWVVGSDPALASAFGRALQVIAQGIGQAIEVEQIPSAVAARDRLEDGPAPALLWLDVRPSEGAQAEELVRRVQREGLECVVYAHVGGADPQLVRRVQALGAIGVWTGLGAAGEVEGEARTRALAGGPIGAAIGEPSITAEISRGLRVCGARRRHAQIRVRVRGLVEDLGALPPGTGRFGVSLERMRRLAAAEAQKACGTSKLAAETLQVDVKTLRGLIDEGPRVEV